MSPRCAESRGWGPTGKGVESRSAARKTAARIPGSRSAERSALFPVAILAAQGLLEWIA